MDCVVINRVHKNFVPNSMGQVVKCGGLPPENHPNSKARQGIRFGVN